MADPTVPDSTDRMELYEGLIDRILSGESIEDGELEILAYGWFRDTESGPSRSFDEVINQVEDGGDKELVDRIDKVASIADTIEEDHITDAIVATIATVGVGGAVGGIRAAVSSGPVILAKGTVGAGGANYVVQSGTTMAGATAAAAATEGAAAGGASLASGSIIPKVGSWLLSQGWKKALKYGGAVALGAGLFIGENEPQSSSSGLGAPPPSGNFGESDGNYIIVSPDGTTQSVPASQLEQGPYSQTQQVAGTELSPDLQAAANALGVNTDSIQYGNYGVEEVPPINSFGFGETQIPINDYPYGVTGKGDPVEEGLTSLAVAPPGGVINNGAFQTITEIMTQDPGGQGTPVNKSYLELIMDSAQRYGVPANLLYGLINQESGFNPNAVGDNGNSHGLVQIYRIAHPDVSIEQARDPRFAINWAARNMAQHFSRFGTWEAAVMAHRNPAGAQYWTNTGQFKVALDKTYTSNIFKYAAESGLSNELFNLEQLASGSISSPGPVAPPYVKPDPATLREFARGTFADILGRSPTDEELNKGVKDLLAGYKSAYNESLKTLGGGTATDVDPSAQFVENLRESGEGQFVEEVDTTRSVFDRMGRIANILDRA